MHRAQVNEEFDMSDRINRFVDAMNVQPNDRILEIGCGHGVAASLICEKLKAGRYLGMDRSPTGLARYGWRGYKKRRR